MPKTDTEMLMKIHSELTISDTEHKVVEALAYQLWLQRGCPKDSDLDDWFEAEKQLRAMNSESIRSVPLMAGENYVGGGTLANHAARRY